MKLSEFDYELPKSLIAQRPADRRDKSRLMVLHRKTGRIEHRSFPDIVSLFEPDDLLVINNTRVKPVRLLGQKPTGGKVEILLIKNKGGNLWEALVKGLSKGVIILSKEMTAEVEKPHGQCNGSSRLVRFSSDPEAYADSHGLMPLPPYIKRIPDAEDRERYQTVYATEPGAIAAPTAGLHFTTENLDKLRKRGVAIHIITLHVGPGTFKAVTAPELKDHTMDEESFQIGSSTADAVTEAKNAGRRVFAVGTTTTRTLETAFKDGRLVPGSGASSLFITPGYRFKAIDGLLTNFHLPKATPLMLTSAFAGFDNTRRAYQEAVKENYRFFSYGDAMLIV